MVGEVFVEKKSPRVRVEVVYADGHVVVYRNIRAVDMYSLKVDGGEWSDSGCYWAYNMLAPHNFRRRFVEED